MMMIFAKTVWITHSAPGPADREAERIRTQEQDIGKGKIRAAEIRNSRDEACLRQRRQAQSNFCTDWNHPIPPRLSVPRSVFATTPGGRTP